LAEVERNKKIKMEEDKRKEAIPSIVKGLTLLNTPINASTPLSTILGGFSYSSQLIEFDDAIVVVEEYFYKNSKRGIEKRLAKSKRNEDTSTKGPTDKVISWKLGKYPQVNAIDTNSTVSAFARENSVSVCELSSTLDIYKEKVAKLEEKLKF